MVAGTVSIGRLLIFVVLFSFCTEWIGADEVECGQRQVSHMGYVVGGQNSLDGDWPWHTALFRTPYGRPREYICGGSIISVNFVLTAAHCVHYVNVDELDVHLGLHNRSNPTEYSKIHKVKEVIIHDKYEASNLRHDMALLRMKSDIEYTDYIQPICLWPEAKSDLEPIVNTAGHVAGWGITDQGVLADVLQEVELKVIDYDTCLASDQKHFRKLLSKKRTNYCAGIPNKATVCPGDSGSGMYFEISNSWYIRGLVSGGKRSKTCVPEAFVTFTDVSHYLKWINGHQKKIKSHNLLNLASCGLDRHDSTVTEDEKPPFQQYSWTVMLEFNRPGSTNNLAMCSGALIHERFVLTVGHCAVAASSMFKLESVRLGEYDLNSNPDKGKNAEGQEVSTFTQSIDVEEIFMHPEFDQLEYDNNIALLKLKHPADTSLSNIQPICLPTLEDYSEAYIISGWKRVGKRSKIIQRNSVALEFELDNCTASYSKYMKNINSEERFICAQHDEPNGGCFHYMGGSPLQYVKNVDQKNRYFLKGLFAYGFPNCKSIHMDIFVNVNGYADWIWKIVTKEGFAE